MQGVYIIDWGEWAGNLPSSRGLDIVAEESWEAPFRWRDVSGTVGLRGTITVRCQLLKQALNRRNDKAVSKYL